MYIAFVDFTKAFDTVNRDLLYGILGRLGCPAKSVRIVKKLYGIHAAVLLWLAYKGIKHTHSIKVRFRYDGDLFDLRRLKSKTKVLALYIREAQYADDVAIFSDTPAGLQILLIAYNDLARKMGLCINTTKTETMCI